MVSKGVELPDDATQAEVEAAVAELVDDPEVHGILVQLPLPDHLDPEPVLALVPPEKDVDGLTERSMGRLVRGLPGHVGVHAARRDATARALRRRDVGQAGGRGRSLDAHRSAAGAPARPQGDRRHGHAGALPHAPISSAVCREADIIVACAGQARMITADHVKPGAAVVDVGVSRTESGIVGDVDFDAVQAVAGAITPMPGGTGPMTIGCLLENTVEAARMLGAI